MLSEPELLDYVDKYFDEFLPDFSSTLNGIYKDIENLLPKGMDLYDVVSIISTIFMQFYSHHLAKIITPFQEEKRKDFLEKFIKITLTYAKESEEEYAQFCKEVWESKHERRE